MSWLRLRIDAETIRLVELSVVDCHGAKPCAIKLRKRCTSNLSQPVAIASRHLSPQQWTELARALRDRRDQLETQQRSHQEGHNRAEHARDVLLQDGDDAPQRAMSTASSIWRCRTWRRSSWPPSLRCNSVGSLATTACALCPGPETP
jgi:hypothetical protein